MIRTLLTSVKQNLLAVVIVSIATGLIVGQFIETGTKQRLQLLVIPALFVMVYPMMINIDVTRVVRASEHVRPMGLSLLINFAISPVIAVGLAQLFFTGSAGYAFGLYMIALIPTSGMTAAWTGLAGGDLEAALVALAVNLLVAVLVLPLYLSVLVGGTGMFDPMALYRQLAVVVVVPMVAGNLTRRYLLSQYDRSGFKSLKPLFGGISSAGVMLIVFIATAMQSAEILSDPITSVSTVIPLVVFYALVLAVGASLGRSLLRTDQSIALIYATSMRNLSIALAIVVASEVIPTEAVLPVALGYLVQPPLGALYMQYRTDVVDGDLSPAALLRSKLPRS
jgi:ACR3 family arsenite efflux pump ArsB